MKGATCTRTGGGAGTNEGTRGECGEAEEGSRLVHEDAGGGVKQARIRGYGRHGAMEKHQTAGYT